MRCREESEKNYHFRKTLNCNKNFRGNNTEALVISKRLKLPQDDRKDINFLAPLRIHFQRSKSTLDSLKSVLKAFRRKPSLGAHEWQSHLSAGNFYCFLSKVDSFAAYVAFAVTFQHLHPNNNRKFQQWQMRRRK